MWPHLGRAKEEDHLLRPGGHTFLMKTKRKKGAQHRPLAPNYWAADHPQFLQGQYCPFSFCYLSFHFLTFLSLFLFHFWSHNWNDKYLDFKLSKKGNFTKNKLYNSQKKPEVSLHSPGPLKRHTEKVWKYIRKADANTTCDQRILSQRNTKGFKSSHKKAKYNCSSKADRYNHEWFSLNRTNALTFPAGWMNRRRSLSSRHEHFTVHIFCVVVWFR